MVLGALPGGLRLPGLRPLGSRRPHAGPIGGDDQIDCVPPRGSRAPRARRAGPSPYAPAISAQSVRTGDLRAAKPRRLPEAGTEPAQSLHPRARRGCARFRARRGGFGSRSGRFPPSRPQAGWRPRGRKPGGAAARSAGRPATARPRQGLFIAKPREATPPRKGPGKASSSRSQGRQPRPGKASSSRSNRRPLRQKKGAAPRGAAPLQALRLPCGYSATTTLTRKNFTVLVVSGSVSATTSSTAAGVTETALPSTSTSANWPSTVAAAWRM